MPHALSQRASQKPSRPASKATAIRSILRPAFSASSRHRYSSFSNVLSSTASFFNGWRSTPGTMPATSQLERLISMTAISVPSGWRGVRHRLRSFNFCMGRSIGSHQRRWIQYPRRRPIASLFYEFCLDEAVPDDHLVRKIDAVLDLSWVHAELAPHYPTLGRPSIDPVLMIRMLIIGYVFGLRSERLLCREVQVNFAYRWFCKLGIEHKIPDHSAFSRARNERFRDSGIFRRVFERVVEACIAADLVGGEGFAVDASLIAADANKQRSIPGSEWQKTRDPETASRAVKEYLATLDDAARRLGITC